LLLKHHFLIKQYLFGLQAKNIGNNQINPSILEIKNNHPELLENSFSFSSINPDFVLTK
jgi:hypothetical protein